MIDFFNLRENDTIRYHYPSSIDGTMILREGVIEGIHHGPSRRPYVTLRLSNGSYKNFSKHKMVDIHMI